MAQEFQVTFGVPMSLQILIFGSILMLHTVLHGLGILLLCGNLWVLGDIGWSLPKYCPIPPQYCMWDCLVLVIENSH